MKRVIRENIPVIVDMTIASSEYRTDLRSVITAATNSREITKTMVKVRSSNIWGYNIFIRDKKSGVGDVYVQFKGKYGGPDDVYVYYDVPIFVYRKWHSQPSKGHYFYYNIRNKYKYSKLTGDKRTKQPGGVTSH